MAQGFTEGLRTPDDTIVFVNPAERELIQQDQNELHGLPVALRLFVVEGP